MTKERAKYWYSRIEQANSGTGSSHAVWIQLLISVVTALLVDKIEGNGP